jgi:hypothetical protein
VSKTDVDQRISSSIVRVQIVLDEVLRVLGAKVEDRS